jgi:CheY-like chemotaxis protein
MPQELVLVVDDNPETLTMLAQALELEGIQVRTAGSVLRAIESLYDGSPRPALIITDLMMPQTSGWDFLKHLRGAAPFKSTPVIVITGADPGQGEELADAVFRKPFDPIKLAETVRSLLQSRTTLY